MIEGDSYIKLSYQSKTQISKIVDYRASLIDECGLSIDRPEVEEYCWNCGSPKDLTRCHIIAMSLGGQDTPNNYVVLCRKCHEEAPNVGDPRIMRDGLIAHNTWIPLGLADTNFVAHMMGSSMSSVIL